MENKNYFRRFRTFGLRNEVDFFVENLSALISAGMSIGESLSSVKEEVKSRRMRNIINEIEEDVKVGVPLHKAFEKARVLPVHMFALVKLGEASGKLSENLKVIVLQSEKENLFRSRVRSSLMYAVIVFVLAIVIGAGTALYTLPKLASFFAEVEAELPMVTKIMIYAGEVLSRFGYVIIPAFLIVIIGAFYFLFSFPKTKFIGHSILFRTPLIKNLIKQVEIARFGFLLGTMTSAGMPIAETFSSMKGTTTFENYKRFYEYLGKNVEEGNSIYKSFNSYEGVKKLFPAGVRQMISAAEKSGSLSDTFYKIGQMYEMKAEATARNLPILIEPILLLLVGAMVAIFALGVLLPIYNLSGAL